MNKAINLQSFLQYFVLVVFVNLIWSDTKKIRKELPCEKEYTKIEFGKGINCKGDTITIFEYSNLYYYYKENSITK